MRRVFVLNTGSSTVKYRLVDAASGEVAASGVVERIGEPGSDTPDHAAALQRILQDVQADAIDAVGHRIVHGGERFTAAAIVDDAVEAQIAELIPLAPLHNPAGLEGIRAARRALPGIPNVAVFDTAFHHTLPPAARSYALDRSVAERYAIRRYGFHGTSYRIVSERAAELLARPLEQLRMVVLHLGNGASAAAIDGGRSVDTSMGLTPLEGLVMGTRSGDVDPAVPIFLQRTAGLGLDEVDQLLNRRSGLLGLAGISDLRELVAAVDRGEEAAQLAFEVYVHRIRHYVGAYAAVLGGIDALVFTAGVGENSARVRAAVADGLGFIGIHVDPGRNASGSSSSRVISPDGGPVRVLVVPTDEEWQIARETAAALE
ncbi:MAG TPA: acetate kinase [Pseudolysinimonas sp.]|nr:acetate kinase [Pseudolysinimonas sp.]